MRVRAALIGALASASIAAPVYAQAVPPVPASTSTDSLACMTAAIYYEAAREPDQGQQAVARVVLNRLADDAYPKSVCGVIFQGSTRHTGCQFTFTCDGSLRIAPDPALWARALTVAAMALASPTMLPGLAATNYHADYVLPLWAATMHRELQIGRHIFYTRHAGQPRPSLAAIAGMASTPQAATTFSAWGLAIARVTPVRGGDVSVDVLAAGR